MTLSCPSAACYVSEIWAVYKFSLYVNMLYSMHALLSNGMDLDWFHITEVTLKFTHSH